MRYFVFISDQKYVVVSVPSTPVKWISFHNHMKRNVVGGKHNVLVLYVNASAPNLSGVVHCNPFKWDILCSFLTKKHVVVSVPSTPAKWILFHNHMKRNAVGGKHNVLIHYVDASAPDSSGVVLCNTFKWDILWFIFLIKNLVIFVCVPATKGEWILLLNHWSRKVVGDKHNVLVHYVDASAPNPFGVVVCNPFVLIFCC